jgi:hypothetical protein
MSRLRTLALAVLSACTIARVTYTGEPPDPPPDSPPDSPPGQPPPEEDCATPGDEDGNGLADCADPACAAVPACQPVHHGIVLITTGTGRGTITASVGGAPCDAACLAGLASGTVVQVTATAAADSWFHGWLDGCDGRHACTVTATDALIRVAADFTPSPNRVFLSSTQHDANLGGVAGGDALCQGLATSAGLDGTYHILLSTSTASWTTRIAGARGWIRFDGEPVGDTTIGAGPGMYNIRFDERGGEGGSSTHWALGAITGMYCADWTSNSSAAVGDASFTSRTALLDGGNLLVRPRCNSVGHFVCAEVDRNVEVSPIATRGRLAFTSTGRWDPTSGIATADALCTSEAAAAGKPGTFKALLATSKAAAISRFLTSGAPWVRVDGLPLLPSARNFQAALALDLAPGVRLDGSIVPSFDPIAFGGVNLGVMSTLAATCNDWSSGASANMVGFSPWDTKVGLSATSCSPLPVLCLQE